MQTHPSAWVRRALLISAAGCLSISVYTGVPAGLADALDKVGNAAQLPLETLAIEQVTDARDAALAGQQMPAASVWQSRDSATIRRDVRAAHERAPGVVHSIRFEDFKHWT
ncbi:hypothetical protein GCM10027093_43070 [Paraburkholderia jirisanensis]